MIVTEQKPFEEIIDSLKGYTKIFLVGCGECAAICKTGGKDELFNMKERLEKQGKTVVGVICPDAPCIAGKTKIDLAKNTAGLKESEVVLILACGLGVQSIRDNQRTALPVIPACNTLCSAVVDSKGDFLEKCSMCGDCVLAVTEGICPVTLCPKGILNGPCGGMNKGKCEVDNQKDCVWVLIYEELDKRNKKHVLKVIRAPKDFKKITKPRKLIVNK